VRLCTELEDEVQSYFEASGPRAAVTSSLPMQQCKGATTFVRTARFAWNKRGAYVRPGHQRPAGKIP